MNHTRTDEGHNTPKLKDETKIVKITHPFHPHYGQTAKVIRIRKGSNARLTVELAGGTKAMVELDHTDFAGAQARGGSRTPTPLLDVDGLLNITKLINRPDSGG